jgi:protein-tyrosine phosphatase
LIVFFVSDRLAFGSKVRLNRHVDKLQELGITHVIDSRNYPSKKLRKFKTIHLNFKDDARPRPMWFYDRALTFYRIAVRNPQAKVFVMCRAGRRRSASLTYFLLRASGYGPDKARDVMRKARPCIQLVRAYVECGELYLQKKMRQAATESKSLRR